MRRLLIFILLNSTILLLYAANSAFIFFQNQSNNQNKKWYKGNTHAHTSNSDGDSTPEEVVKWYLDQKYNFLVLTDHNFLNNVENLNSQFSRDEQFIVIKGEEITESFNSKPLHINGLNIDREIKPQGGNSIPEVLQKNVNAIREANGVPHINHPNFGWAIGSEDLKKVENNKLFEIFNGHPLVNNLGGGDKPSLEQMWDSILSEGKLLYGIAVDDAHHFKIPWDKSASLPGKGWIYVRAANLSAKSILESLEKGDFYASTGVELVDYQVDNKEININIKTEKWSKYRIQFIGKGGKILSEITENPAVYRFRGNEMYVRAKIIESNGKLAWTQPIMLNVGK